MSFPFTFWDLCLWISINAIILLATSEILSAVPDRRFVIVKKKLRIAVSILSTLFLIMILVRAYETLTFLQP